MTVGLASEDLTGKEDSYMAKLLLIIREELAHVLCHSAASAIRMTASLFSSVTPILYGPGELISC